VSGVPREGASVGDFYTLAGGGEIIFT